jgi:hypothetical protein
VTGLVTVGARRSPCTVCGEQPSGRYSVSLRGERTCVDHPVGVRCAFCGRPTPRTDPGWHWLGADLARCPTCGCDCVESRDDVKGCVPAIRSELAAFGLELKARVQVALAAQAELSALAPDHHAIGLTRMVSTGPGDIRVTNILVLGGLPRLQFGRTVAHEAGHAWLAQTGNQPKTIALQEGFCELVAVMWLSHQSDPYAEALRAAARENADPVYGGGLREAWERTTPVRRGSPQEWAWALASP